jgi:hypothetical protein
VNAAPQNGRDVFLVHGRDLEAKDALVALLHAFDLKVISWGDASTAAGGGTPSTLDIVRAGIDMATAVVVLFTPDDVGYLRHALREPTDKPHETEPTGQARLNVVFEAGLAMGIKPGKVVFVEVGQIRGMSDTQGLHVLRLTDGVERRRDLAKRLKAAGLYADTDNEVWKEAGSFSPPALVAADLLASPPAGPEPARISGPDAETRVLRHIAAEFAKPGVTRINTPFEVDGLEWPEVQAALRDLYDSQPPYIRGVSMAEADYPVVITSLTERGRKEGRGSG